MKQIGVVILSYNNFVDTQECVESFINLKTNHKVTILVVDNSSEESYFLKNQELSKAAVVIRQEKNNGYASGNNIGINYFYEKNYDYVLIINNDTVVEPTFLDRLVEKFDDTTGLVAPTIYTCYDEPKKIWSSGGFYRKKYATHSMKRDHFNGVRENSFISGCCFLMKLEHLPLIGYISEDYFMYSEDSDFSYQFVKKGLKLKTVSDSIIYHKESVSTGKESAFQLYYINRGKLLFIYKNYKGLKKAYALSVNFTIILLRIIKHIIKRDKKHIYLWWALVDRKKTGKSNRLI